jgi:ABC-type multidrug transport system ATPase subunit
LQPLIAFCQDTVYPLRVSDWHEARQGLQGINISGGQKQRIQIARAVYANPSIVLMDDPFSALDAKVGRTVFKRCIQGELKHTTRLVVTNQLQYVADADRVVVLKDGVIAESGKFKTLMAQNGVLTSMMQDVHDDDGREASGVQLVLSSASAAPKEHIGLPDRGDNKHVAIPGAQGWRGRGERHSQDSEGVQNCVLAAMMQDVHNDDGQDVTGAHFILSSASPAPSTEPYLLA